MNDITYPEVAEAGQLAQQSYAIALAVKIDCATMYEIAGDELRGIVTRRKQIEELRLSLTRPLDEGKKRIMDLFRAPTDRLAQAENLVREEMSAYQRLEREKAEALRREAEAKAAADRAEAERQQRDAAERECAAREEAALARASGDHEAARRAESAALDAELAAEQAREQMDLVDIAPPMPLAVAAPKASGVSARQNWKAEITDFKALVLAAAKRAEAGDDFLLGFLLPNEKALNASAKSMQAQLRMPGVRVYAEDILSVRRKSA